MTLTDPHEALAEQSNFIGYLMGISGLSKVVRVLAADGDRRADPPSDADDFIHVLLGLASLGDSVGRLAESTPARRHWAESAPASDLANRRWLR